MAQVLGHVALTGYFLWLQCCCPAYLLVAISVVLLAAVPAEVEEQGVARLLVRHQPLDALGVGRVGGQREDRHGPVQGTA